MANHEKEGGKILFVVCTHGNEEIGNTALKNASASLSDLGTYFDTTIGNPEAFARGVRFVDTDLNRIFPGKENSPIYEEARAYELLAFAKDYAHVIDIHGTKSATGIFTIVTNPVPEAILLSAALPIENVVIWESSKPSPLGPLTRFIASAVEIEAGVKDDPAITRQLTKILKKIIAEGILISKENLRKRTFFQVYGKILKSDLEVNALTDVRNFNETSVEGETFTPLMVGEYPDILC
jgi:succinylglutamate desuccinylase